MNGKLPYLILMAVGAVILGLRTLTGAPIAHDGGTPTPSPTVITSAHPGASQTDAPPSLLPGKGSPPPQTAGGSGLTLQNFSTVPNDQAQTWASGLVNSNKLLRSAITGDQVSTLPMLEDGTMPYSDIAAALQYAQSNHFQPLLSADMVVSQITLVDLSDADKGQLSRWGKVNVNQAWLVTYQQPVYLVYGPSQVLTINQSWVEAGYLKSNSDLGPIWVDTFRLDCSGSGSSISLCNQP